MDEEKTTPQDTSDTAEGNRQEQRNHEYKFSHKIKNNRIFLTTMIALIAFIMYIIVNVNNFTSFIKGIGSIVAPIIVGGIIAYLCNPILKFYEYKLFRKMKKNGARRGLSLALTFITVFAIIIAIGFMMIPELLKSIQELLANYESYVNGLFDFINNIINSITSTLGVEGEDASNVTEYINLDMFKEFLSSSENILDNILDLITKNSSITNGISNAVFYLITTFKNLLLGIFIAFYIMVSKEKRIAQVNKFRKAVFSDETNKKITEIATLTDKCFGGFIYSTIIDSIIAGLLTFIMLTIFEISPYNILISTFVGLTNMIPVFGPFIGAIPSFFIVLISNPSKALLFIILILIIQQVDGNIIAPKIMGDNTGVSSLCVIIAITICGSLWGIGGMLIGVPLFAVVVELIKRTIENKLKAKGESTDTVDYYPADALGNAEQEVYYEHSPIKYRYEHSKLKPFFSKMRVKFYNITSRNPLRHNNNTNSDDTPEAAEETQEKDLHDDQQNKD